MPTQKFKNRQVRKLIKLGRGSLAVTLPVEIVSYFKWKEKQNVVIKKIRGGVVVKDWKK